MVERELLYFADAAAWRAWLELNHETSPGINLKIAKKASPHTTPTYHEALDEALCFGWIDGQRNRLDDHFFMQAFTPRTKRSTWSQINRDKVAALIAEGRMQPAGQAEIDRAKGDGRWDAAYAGPATIEVPPELSAALAASPAASAMFEKLSSQNRYAILFRIGQAKMPETRARNVAKFVAMLERGETVYPQRTK